MSLSKFISLSIFTSLLFIGSVDTLNAKEGIQRLQVSDTQLFMKRLEKAFNAIDNRTSQYFISQNVPTASIFIQKHPIQVAGWSVFAPQTHTHLDRDRFTEHLLFKKRSVNGYMLEFNTYAQYGLNNHRMALVRATLEEKGAKTFQTQNGSAYEEDVNISNSVCEMFFTKENDHVRLLHLACRPQNETIYVY